MNERLLALIAEEAPAFISLIKDLFAKRHPDQPVPTSEEILTAWFSLAAASLAKDADILSRHRPTDGTVPD